MNLPYDYARCTGTTQEICQTCRRTEPGHPTRQSFFSFAPAADGTCEHYIAPPVAEQMPAEES